MRPRTPEQEKRRLDAVRLAMKKRIYARGYTRSKEHIQPMLDALKRKMDSDPEKYRKISIGNLPKDIKGEKNGNWRGGKTKEHRDFRTNNSTRLRKLKKFVTERDGNRCKNCGSTDGPFDLHHILSVGICRRAAFMPLNLILLCKRCHKNTKSYAGKERSVIRQITKDLNLTTHAIATIPHHWQVYPTVGNWAHDGDFTLVLVSDTGNEAYNHLVAFHETIEAMLCFRRGIPDIAVDAFDVAYETNRPVGDLTEPGNDPKSPYHREHTFATFVEKLLANELGVDWQEYENAINALE